MGEAKRRKLLDPNFGKPNLDDLFINSNPLMKGTKISQDVLIEFAVLFVPQSILDSFVDFHWAVEHEEVPFDIRSEYPNDPIREFMELDWHDETKQWITDFLNGLVTSRNLNKWQLLNANRNIRKGIILYALKSPCPYEIDCED